MAQQDNKDWEKQWEGAFSEASEKPSSLVWKSIEASLANGGASKKAWLLWVAAAFLGGVITTASIFFILRDSEKTELAQNALNEQQVSAVEVPSNKALSVIDNKNVSQSREAGTRPPLKNQKTNKRALNVLSEDLNQKVLSFSQTEQIENQSTESPTQGKDLASLFSIKPSFVINESVLDIEIDGIYIYDAAKFKPKSENDNSKWLAGVALSAGAFQQNGASANTSLADAILAPRNKGFVNYSATGQSTVMAMNVGRRLSQHWLVSGGLGYQVTTNQSSSNLMMVSTANKDVKNVVGEIQPANTEQGIAAVKEAFELEVSPDIYQMKNSYQFVSVPFNVGYFLIDKKWKLNLNGGLNTDIFYQYSSKDESGDLNEYVVKPSDDENWKYLNLSLGGGIEVSKVFADNYMVTLAPGYRHSLSEFGVPGSNQLQPHVFNVSLKLNYIF